MQLTVLIIDDEVKLAGLLSRIIELEGYRVLQAHTAKDAWKVLIAETIHLILSDVKLPDASDVALVSQLKEKYPYTEIICLTAYGTIQDGVSAIKNGAFDYITKGDDNERILPLLSRAAEKAEAQYRLHQLEKKLINEHGFDRIIGGSVPITQATNLAKKVARRYYRFVIRRNRHRHFLQ